MDRKTAVSLIPWIERNWSVTWGEDKVQVEMVFSCSQAASDKYRFVVDRCAVRDSKAAVRLDKLLSVADLSGLIYCPGIRK